MNTIVRLKDFRPHGRALPTLVLVDLHRGSGGAPATNKSIANCRLALKHARACGMPIAFTRQAVSPQSLLASPNYPRWIEGFEPSRWDMVFDRNRPSCYASAEFRKMTDEIGGDYVLGGQFGELACLSTAIDAYHRDHRPLLLIDAIAGLTHDDAAKGATSAGLSRILSLYAEPALTESWIICGPAPSGGEPMKPPSSLHPLKYMADALSQIASTLRDFELYETADLVDRAKSDLNRTLAENPDHDNAQ